MAAVFALCLVLILWAGGRLNRSRSDWDAGTPVLVSLTAFPDPGTAEVTEYQSTRIWTIDRRALEPIGADTESAIGTQIQARVVGECRCQLALFEPRVLPPIVPFLVLVGLLGTVPGLVARFRWRRLRPVLARPSRPVTATPVWLRRPLRPAAWGVRVLPAEGGAPLYVELAGTPPPWLGGTAQPPSDMEMYGPDTANGLVVLRTDTGLAVASAAPRKAASAAAVVMPWSDALSVAAGLADPSPEAPLELGGPGHSRVRVGLGPGSAAVAGDRTGESLRYRPSATALQRTLVVGATYAVAALVVRSMVEDLFNAAIWIVGAGMVAGAVVRRLSVFGMAHREPLRTWTDRRAAAQAAAAAAAAGFTAP